MGRIGSLEQLRDIIEDKKMKGFQTEESICFAFPREVLTSSIPCPFSLSILAPVGWLF